MTQPQSRRIIDAQKRANHKFSALLAVGGLWAGLSLFVVWRYVDEFLRYLYYICRANWEYLLVQSSSSVSFLIPLLSLLMISRAIYLIIRRLYATRIFSHTLKRYQVSPPLRLIHLIKQSGLSGPVVCMDTTAVSAFSLGIWRPKIWLSTALIDLLTDDELLAVLQHESHHCRQRDPLRLFLSRIISDSFFFVPVLRNLSEENYLAQEVAADANAVSTAGDSLPLASALHKLLTAPNPRLSISEMVISQLNVTEHRILALVSDEKPARWRLPLLRWLATIGLALFLLSSASFMHPKPHPAHTITHCTAEQVTPVQLDFSQLRTLNVE